MKSKLFYRVKELLLHIGKKWDKLSVSEDTATSFAYANINPEPALYKKGTVIYSPEYYLAHCGEDINKRFREGRPDADDLEAASMVDSHSTKVPLVLYRGVCSYVFSLMQENAEGMKDTDLYEKAFLQTSLVKGHEIQSIIRLRIYVPKGAHVVFLGNVNGELECYYEVVIARGSKLKVVSYDGTYFNCVLVV